MIKNIFVTTLITLCIYTISKGQTSLDYYLPQDIKYNKNIPTPKSVIGHEVGEWHISHDRLLKYMYALAAASDRVTIRQFGETYENRPQVVLTITSPENHKNINTIKKQHVQLTNPTESANLDIKSMPAVTYLGYSVHGNEPSGTNASLAVAYYLAAATGPEIDKMLNEMVILLDPSFNPDGLNRFANYVNSRKSYNLSTDTNSMELNELWPRGRTNHYWFDLNRDWLPVQLPESKAKISMFHEWKPNVLTDHHEMGSNSSFFFQPGIPSRNNPLTPVKAYELTDRMGEYHAKALDQIQSLYYARESFDDYYYGKGSSYPDVNGAVGILFEQASARGHARETDNGILDFPFAIRNHFTASLSTLQAVGEMREEFLEHQRQFYIDALKKSKSDAVKAITFGSKDKSRNYHLAELIDRHQISIYHSKQSQRIDGIDYGADETYIVPLNQPQYTLIKAMFEKRTSFQDSLFYDVSSWTLPLAFGLDYKELNSKSYNNALLGEAFDPANKVVGSIEGEKSQYAYVFEWYDYYSPKMLYALLDKGYRVKVANEPFYRKDGKRFERGSILISVGIQDENADTIYRDLQELVKSTGVTVYPFNTGLDYKGVSLGSPKFTKIQKPKIALLVEGRSSSYDAGEIWHLFDQRYNIDLTLMPIRVFNRADLDKYTTVVMVSGNYNDISKQANEKFKRWIENGGNLIVSKNAISYLPKLGVNKFTLKKKKNAENSTSRRYADIDEFRGAQQIGGAIFETTIDNTHPLLYGYYKSTLPIFRNSTIFLEKSKNPYANPIVYNNKTLLSGYISAPNLEMLRNSSAVGVARMGKGKVIGFTDNLNFRAFWYGTNKIFMNAIFFGPSISGSASR